MARQITTVLIDLSGTLHIDNIAIPGAVQALNRLNFFSSFVFLIFNSYVLLLVCANYMPATTQSL